MSVAARGKVGLHLAEGKPLPPGWILDRFGRPSTDPADLATGLGVPIGGHKGYGLTLVMEALAGVLTGAGFCWDQRREPGSTEPPNLGHFFIAINPELFAPLAEFTARVDRMIAETKGGEKMENVEAILVPGEMEMQARERNLREGVPLLASTYHVLEKYRRLGIEGPTGDRRIERASPAPGGTGRKHARRLRDRARRSLPQEDCQVP